jgi:thioredoxin-like negative regulator of GroEL
MSGILYLTSDDFQIQTGNNGNLLCTEIKNYSLILFYYTECVHCKTILPIFKRLPDSIHGCQFGIINVGLNKSVVEKSKNTVNPIKYVPYIVFYVEGKPYMIYKGPYSIEEIGKFIMEVVKNLKDNRLEFSKQKVVQEDGNRIPSYCIGKPICGNGNVCYLDFTKAYVTENKR